MGKTRHSQLGQKAQNLLKNGAGVLSEAADLVLDAGATAATTVASLEKDKFVRDLLASVEFKALEQYYNDFYGPKKTKNRQFYFFNVSEEKGKILGLLIQRIKQARTEKDVRDAIQKAHVATGQNDYFTDIDVLSKGQSFFGYILALIGLTVPESYAKVRGLEQYVSDAMLASKHHEKLHLDKPEFAKLKSCSLGLRDPAQQQALNVLCRELEATQNPTAAQNLLTRKLNDEGFKRTFTDYQDLGLFTPKPLRLIADYHAALESSASNKAKRN